MPESEEDWSQPPAIPPKQLADYVPAITVVVEDGSRVLVPVNSDANRLQSQVAAAKLRSFMAKQIEGHEATGELLKPHDLKALVDSWAKVEENARFAYAPALTADELGEGSTTPAQLVKAMAEGMTNAHIKSESGRMERALQLGKTKNVTPIIEAK